MQEEPIRRERQAARSRSCRTLRSPQGDAAAVAETARSCWSNAEKPGDRRRPLCAHARRHRSIWSSSPRCCNAPIVDTSGRMNLPSRHPLNQSSRARGHVAAGRPHPRPRDERLLELAATLPATGSTAPRSRIAKPDARTVSIGARRSLHPSSNYQDFQRYADIDLAIAADAEATMPYLIEAVRKLVNGEQKAAYEARGKKLAANHHADLERVAPRRDLRLGRQPDHHRAAVRGAVGADQERGLVAGLDRPPRSAIGRSGCGRWTSTTSSSATAAAWASAMRASASVGAALANRKHGRLTVAHAARRRPPDDHRACCGPPRTTRSRS